MLVLSRRTNEKIVLPNIETTIQIVSIRPGVVRVGIEAPTHVAVYREEILSADKRAALPRFTPTLTDEGLATLHARTASLRAQVQRLCQWVPAEQLAALQAELDALEAQLPALPATPIASAPTQNETPPLALSQRMANLLEPEVRLRELDTALAS